MRQPDRRQMGRMAPGLPNGDAGARAGDPERWRGDSTNCSTGCARTFQTSMATSALEEGPGQSAISGCWRFRRTGSTPTAPGRCRHARRRMRRHSLPSYGAGFVAAVCKQSLDARWRASTLARSEYWGRSVTLKPFISASNFHSARRNRPPRLPRIACDAYTPGTGTPVAAWSEGLTRRGRAISYGYHGKGASLR